VENVAVCICRLSNTNVKETINKFFVKTVGGPTWVQAECLPNKIIAEYFLHATLLQLDVSNAPNQVFVSGSSVQFHTDVYEVHSKYLPHILLITWEGKSRLT